MSSDDSNQPEHKPQPLTLDQLVNHKRPSDPKVSPDGEQVVYTVRPISKEGEHEECAIWIVPFAGGSPRQLTSSTGNDESPVWSPDGQSIAFLSDRAERGKSSLYVMPMSGGEAVRVFDQEGEMGDPNWSPDGRFLAVLYTDPETEEEKKKREEKDDVRVWDTDYKYRRLWVIDVAAQSGKVVSPEGRQVWSYAWAPDSQRLALNTTATPRIDDIFRETDVSIVPREGGGAHHVFQMNGDASDLLWSPDGLYLAYRGPAGRVSHGDYVYKRPVTGGDATCLTPDYAGTTSDLIAIGDGTTLLLQGEEGMHSAVYTLSWEGQLSPVLSADIKGSLPKPASADAAGKHFAFIWESATSSPDLWVADCDAAAAGQLERRTHYNPEMESACIGQPEIVTWTSDEGVTIEGMLLKPAGYVAGERYPLVVQVHGGPTSRWGDEFVATWHDWGHALAGRGFAVLMPNPRGSTGYGPAFSNALFNDVGGCEFRDMMTGVDAMIERGIADPDRLAVGGWSWGGYMTGWTVSQTGRFKAAIMGAGLPNMVSDNSLGDIPSANLSYFEHSVYHDPEPYWERSAIRYIRNATTPTLILHGEEDYRVATPQGLELYMALKTLGVETQFVTYPREPHTIQERKHQRDLAGRVIDWYSRFLMPERGAVAEEAAD